jgi:hypothetical protein
MAAVHLDEALDGGSQSRQQKEALVGPNAHDAAAALVMNAVVRSRRKVHDPKKTRRQPRINTKNKSSPAIEEASR